MECREYKKLLAKLNPFIKELKKDEQRRKKHQDWVKSTHNKWIKVGSFSVDGGVCFITAPEHILELEKASEKRREKQLSLRPRMGPLLEGYKSKNGCPIGVEVSTGQGDGNYEVYAKLFNGEVREVKVKFF
jgi:hypothetical protein